MKYVRFEGKKQFEDNIQKLLKMADAINIATPLHNITAEAASQVRDSIKMFASSQNVPKDILKDVFSTSKPRRFSDGTRKITQLAGIRLRGRSRPFAHAYKEWRAKHSMTKIRIRKKTGKIINRGTVSQGQLIGMSLATMYEFGTSKQKPRPFFRPAVRNAMPQVKNTLITGFKNVIEETLR